MKHDQLIETEAIASPEVQEVLRKLNNVNPTVASEALQKGINQANASEIPRSYEDWKGFLIRTLVNVLREELDKLTATPATTKGGSWLRIIYNAVKNFFR